jgi:hypothetical protein
MAWVQPARDAVFWKKSDPFEDARGKSLLNAISAHHSLCSAGSWFWIRRLAPQDGKITGPVLRSCRHVEAIHFLQA